MRLLSLSFVGLLICSACSDADRGQPGDHIVGGDGSFQTATLWSSGGMPSHFDGDECNTDRYVNTITVTAEPPTATWDACLYKSDSSGGHHIVNKGSRSITSDELASVKEALGQVRIGNSGLCGADKSNVILDVQARGITGRYADDFYGCRPSPDGRTFVIGIGAVELEMWQLPN